MGEEPPRPGRGNLSPYDVIVIGTGIGGSAAAGLLARAGLRVLALEKNPRLGGSCSFYEKRGFHVDWGTHMFSRGHRGPLGAVQRRLAIVRPKYRNDLARFESERIEPLLAAAERRDRASFDAAFHGATAILVVWMVLQALGS